MGLKYLLKLAPLYTSSLVLGSSLEFVFSNVQYGFYLTAVDAIIKFSVELPRAFESVTPGRQLGVPKADG